jgi:hypothetical protein
MSVSGSVCMILINGFIKKKMTFSWYHENLTFRGEAMYLSPDQIFFSNQAKIGLFIFRTWQILKKMWVIHLFQLIHKTSSENNHKTLKRNDFNFVRERLYILKRGMGFFVFKFLLLNCIGKKLWGQMNNLTWTTKLIHILIYTWKGHNPCRI